MWHGSSPRILACVLSKPPHDGKQVLWHQDGSYWPLAPVEVVSLWLEVDSVFGSGMDDSLVDESSAVDFVMAPGDVSVHHPNLIPGSGANHSPNRRCGLTIRYIPTTTRILDDPWPSSILMRGDPVPGINKYLPLPAYVAVDLLHVLEFDEPS